MLWLSTGRRQLRTCLAEHVHLFWSFHGLPLPTTYLSKSPLKPASSSPPAEGPLSSPPRLPPSPACHRLRSRISLFFHALLTNQVPSPYSRPLPCGTRHTVCPWRCHLAPRRAPGRSSSSTAFRGPPEPHAVHVLGGEASVQGAPNVLNVHSINKNT